MSVYLKDGMVLLDGGLVAADSVCCCGGPIAQCDCGFGPFHRVSDDTYWTTVTDNSCDGTTTYGGPTTSDARFNMVSTVETGCGGVCVGTLTGLFAIAGDGSLTSPCGSFQVSCIGEILCSGIPSGYTCHEGADPSTVNVQTLSGEVVCGACCRDLLTSSCVGDTELHCGFIGGTYQGNNTVCFPGICGGACCVPDSGCFDNISESFCGSSGGTWYGLGTICEDIIGACCFDGFCFEEVCQGQCEFDGGVFAGIGTTCDPNPC